MVKKKKESRALHSFLSNQSPIKQYDRWRNKLDRVGPVSIIGIRYHALKSPCGSRHCHKPPLIIPPIANSIRGGNCLLPPSLSTPSSICTVDSMHLHFCRLTHQRKKQDDKRDPMMILPMHDALPRTWGRIRGNWNKIQSSWGRNNDQWN